ncbi:MAG: uridylate kinase [Firmicutes bacterium]|nr:uridylate kinase [Bacillota bacterium]
MIELVGKIGSMALIDKVNGDIDYNKFANLGRQLKPGMIWVSSGAVEIGRIDYMRRTGAELPTDDNHTKANYAAQGQAILMNMYRNFINPQYGIRQFLVEHNHFNNEKKSIHIKKLLEAAAKQNCVPIVNYNDAVSCEELRKFEIGILCKKKQNVLELVDNDETASQIACLVKAKTLLILSTLDGIYEDVCDPTSLIREISAPSFEALNKKLDEVKLKCLGASRAGANGAKYKLEYIKPCLAQGTQVIIASAKYNIDDILAGRAPSTVIINNSKEF